MLFSSKKKSEGTAITVTHMDNMVMIADSIRELTHVQKKLFKVFEMKEEDSNCMMGFQLVEDRKERTISILHG
jgi:hypothetical protein